MQIAHNEHALSPSKGQEAKIPQGLLQKGPHRSPERHHLESLIIFSFFSKVHNDKTNDIFTEKNIIEDPRNP